MALTHALPVSDEAVLDAVIEEQERRFCERMPRSQWLRREARGVLAGGVASSWQAAPPQTVWLSHGLGSKVFDVDGTEYVDLHAGFGAMLVGHAHPAVVRAVQDRVALGTHFAQPTGDTITVARELARRFHLPLWRFCNSGTEATMSAIHLMRIASGRERIIKVEGSYHGHHDAVQVSVYPDLDDAGPASRPVAAREHGGVPSETARLTVVVPFGDLEAVERAFLEHPGEIAGMIIEPAMMNIGIIEPPPGYLAALRALCHRFGAFLTYDEVKTGLSVAPGGMSDRSGVVPDIVCLAKALGGGLPCGAIGGTFEIMHHIEDGSYEQVGTFNGNPLTMAAARATLLEVLTPESYAWLDTLRAVMVRGANDVIAKYRLPAYVQALGAKGCVVFSATRLRNYRDFVDCDGRWGHAHWLYQHNGGVFLPPWGKCEQWTLSVQHDFDDVERFRVNFEQLAIALRGAR